MSVHDVVVARGRQWNVPRMREVPAVKRIVRKVTPTPVTDRLAEAKTSPEFAAITEVCKACSEYSSVGGHCAEIKRTCGCGAGSVRLRWAQRKACPLGKWTQ